MPDYVESSALPAAPNVSLTGYVRHAAVLPHAALLVTHAGLGSVVVALAHGVPMLCLPLDREQPENARAVEDLGAGRMLDPDADPATLRAAIEDLLVGPAPTPLRPDPAAAAARCQGTAVAAARRTRPAGSWR